MYSIFIIIHILISANAQNISYIEDELMINYPCFFRATGQYGVCLRIGDCPSAVSALNLIPFQNCAIVGFIRIVCCPFVDPEVSIHLERDFSSSKIINMCYNYYADTRHDKHIKCDFDENCKVTGCVGDPITLQEDFHRYQSALGWKRDNNEDGYDFLCKAFLVASHFVLAAAHCMQNGNPDVVNFPNAVYFLIQIIKVEDVFIHPEYNPLLAYNDIAIVQLANTPNYHALYCLWVHDANLVSNFLRTRYPWGISVEDVNILSNTACNNQFTGETRLPNGIINSQLCAVNTKGMADTCQGESDGPIFTELTAVIKPECNLARNIRYLVGIPTDGDCGDPLFGVYTRVSSYVDWIDSIIFGNSSSSWIDSIIFATPANISHSEDQLVIKSPCFFRATGQDGICLSIYDCPSTEEYFQESPFQTCFVENDVRIICCPIVDPEVSIYIERDFSSTKIINMCYNYYADAWHTKYVQCNFDENCHINGCIGDPVNLYTRRYQAALGWKRNYTDNNEDDYDFHCKAYFVAEHFVLAAAHCMQKGNPDIVHIRTKIITVNDVFIHPEYKPLIAYNDIAVIKLSNGAYDLTVLTCLWVHDTDFVPTFFGAEDHSGKTVFVGTALELNNTACNNQFSGEPRLPNGIANSQICVVEHEGKIDMCQEDSGDPLYHEVNAVIKPECKLVRNILFIVGIPVEGVCGVYTRVSAYVDWIDSIIFGPVRKIEFHENPLESLIEGSHCSIRYTGQDGICTNLYDCPSVLSALPKISPEICYVGNSGPVVCCPISDKIGRRRVDTRVFNNKIINNCYSDYAENSKWNCHNGKCSSIHECYGGGMVGPAGGSKEHILSHMYMASLGWRHNNTDYDFLCGAFLVARNFVLTAAHCMKEGDPNIVRLGDKVYDPQYSQDINITTIYVHPEYTPLLAYNDIALVKLAMEADAQFILACLWEGDINWIGTGFNAIGFGATVHGGPSTNDLYKVKLELMNNTVCADQFSEDSKSPNGIISSQLCAGDPKRKMDTCRGDSGGPLFTKMDLVIAPSCKRSHEPIAHVVGITSYGQACGGSLAGVYTRVSSYFDWIDSVVFEN